VVTGDGKCCGPPDTICNGKCCPQGRLCSTIDGCCNPGETLVDGKCFPFHPPGAGIVWTRYPSLTEPLFVYKWLVVECQAADAPSIPLGLDTNIRQFLGLPGVGYGNIIDYFHDVSYNAAEIVTEIVPWVLGPSRPGNRADFVQKCLQAIPPDQAPDFANYYGVIVVSNAAPSNAGACSIGKASMTINNQQYQLACVYFDQNSLDIEFAAHEIGHGLGLDHSFDNTSTICGSGGKPGEYCDPWDIMSARLDYSFLDRNWLEGGTGSPAGPGMAIPNLLRLGWLLTANEAVFQLDEDEQTFTIQALSHAQVRPSLQGQPPLVVVMDIGPWPTYYTVEYRQSDGWDQGFQGVSAGQAGDAPPAVQKQGGAVLVHKALSVGEPATTLIETANKGALLQGDTLVLTGEGGLNYHVKVTGIGTANGTATVSIGHGTG